MKADTIPDGYARVTDILSIFQAYAHVDRKKLKAAQDLGTDIHAAIEAYFNDEFDPLTQKKMGYFDSFLKWAKTASIAPLEQEKRYYDDDLKITGRIDLIAEIDGVKTIIDFKTGSWAHPEIWKLQGTFYRMLCGQDIRQFLFVQLMKDGSIPILYPFCYSKADEDVCLSALDCYTYFKSCAKFLS